jgi:hypothetical protein
MMQTRIFIDIQVAVPVSSTRILKLLGTIEIRPCTIFKNRELIIPHWFIPRWCL